MSSAIKFEINENTENALHLYPHPHYLSPSPIPLVHVLPLLELATWPHSGGSQQKATRLVVLLPVWTPVSSPHGSLIAAYEHIHIDPCNTFPVHHCFSPLYPISTDNQTKDQLLDCNSASLPGKVRLHLLVQKLWKGVLIILISTQTNYKGRSSCVM